MDAWLCLRRLYGDESELHFWTVAAHYLHSWSQEKSTSTPAAQEAAPRDRASNPLDICYDVLCENAYFQVPWRIPTRFSPEHCLPMTYVSVSLFPWETLELS